MIAVVPLGQRDAILRLRLRGELDVGRSQELALQLFDALTAANCRLLIVDLDEATYVDIAVVGLLERARRVARWIGVDFVLANPGDAARRVIGPMGALATLTTPSFHTHN